LHQRSDYDGASEWSADSPKYAGRPFGEEEFLGEMEGTISAKMEAEWQRSRTKGRELMRGWLSPERCFEVGGQAGRPLSPMKGFGLR
jgi:hypothetical protein